jgi:hypothetical protein
MFIAALFTIAKLWKQTRCPTTDKWIEGLILNDFGADIFQIMKKTGKIFM